LIEQKNIADKEMKDYRKSEQNRKVSELLDKRKQEE